MDHLARSLWRGFVSLRRIGTGLQDVSGSGVGLPIDLFGRHAWDMADQGRSETPDERADRNFAEAVQELRVAQTGVQVLFAFLLTLPFYSDFPTGDQRYSLVYTAALLSAAAAAIIFIAPVSFHRQHFREGKKEEVVWLTHVLFQVGLVALALAMTLAIWIVMALIWNPDSAYLITAGVVGFTLLAWLLLPKVLLRRQG